jgi:hypothetical protein
MPTEAEAPKPWPARIAALVFVLTACYSVYLAVRLLTAHCEGFSCTYLGMAWMFWLVVLCLPTTIVGFFVHRIKSISARWRRVLRGVWLAHTLFALGLGLTWLVRRF